MKNFRGPCRLGTVRTRTKRLADAEKDLCAGSTPALGTTLNLICYSKLHCSTEELNLLFTLPIEKKDLSQAEKWSMVCQPLKLPISQMCLCTLQNLHSLWIMKAASF